MFLELKENVSHGSKEYPFCQYHISYHGCPYQCPVHWHDEFEIIYVKEGIVSLTINDESYVAKKNSIHLINPRELHLMGSSDPSVSYYAILFPLEFISFQTMDDLENHYMQPLRSGQKRIINELRDPKLLQGLYPILDELVSLHPYKDSANRYKCRLLLLQAFFLIASQPDTIFPSVTKSQATTQMEILTYILMHYTENITLANLSKEFHLSEKYISRYFKEHFQLGFTQYLNHLRLSHARKLLETTALPVTEVALQSGYENVSYFIRLFKKNTGKAPLQYRHSIN